MVAMSKEFYEMGTLQVPPKGRDHGIKQYSCLSKSLKQLQSRKD